MKTLYFIALYLLVVFPILAYAENSSAQTTVPLKLNGANVHGSSMNTSQVLNNKTALDISSVVTDLTEMAALSRKADPNASTVNIEMTLADLGHLLDSSSDATQLKGTQNESRVSVMELNPIIYHDDATDIYFYVESDGRSVTAFSRTGDMIWHRNPFMDGHLSPYRFSHPVIIWIGRTTAGNHIGIVFNSSQFGNIDEKNGNFIFQGQD